MRLLSQLRIKDKLMVITMLVSASALLMACAAFVVVEEYAARKQMVQALNITAAMTAANSTAGLSFDEAGSVEQALKSLSAQPDIVQACVYDRSGRLFARYLRAGLDKAGPPPAAAAGVRFDRQRLRLFQTISLAGENIGTIYLEQDLSQLTARLWHLMLISGLVLLACATLAFFLSVQLQKLISKPVSELAGTMATVRVEKNYSVRAIKSSEDELGSLIDGFNEMLAQIQERDKNLERRVAERTRELGESLSVLNATLSSTADGILVVNPQRKKIFQNRRMVELWKLPPEIAASNEMGAQFRQVASLMADPGKFLKEAEFYQTHPDQSARFEDAFKDGTILECNTAPVMDQEGRNYGRIWTFRDVTQSRKYEAQLEESRARFKFIFESVPVGIASHFVHTDGRVVREVNQAHLRICGLTREQHDMPDTYTRITHPADHARQREFIQQIQDGRINQYAMEKRYFRADGTTVWVAFSYQRQHYADGSYEELTTLVDISESKRTEAALRESEAKFYSLVDQMPAGVFRKDFEGRYEFVNSWFCRIKGVKPERFLGKRPQEVEGRIPELADAGTQHHEEILRTGRQIEFDEMQVGPDGKVSYFHAVKSPVYGPDGTVVGSQGILLDVTQRKLAEEELAYERDLLRALLDSSPDPIYFKDRESRFIKTSSRMARQFGVASPEELVGRSDFDFFAEEHARPAFEDEQEIIRTGRPLIGKIERESWKDGRQDTWVLTTKMPFRSKTGEIIGTFGISKDITAIKQAEYALAYERDLLKALLDQSPDSIFFKDLQSRYVKLSRSELNNLFMAALSRHRAAHPDDAGGGERPAHLRDLEPFHAYVIGKTAAEIHGAEDAAEFNRDEQAIIQTGQAIEGKVEKTLGPDGQPVWYLTTKAPWHNKEGEIIGTFGTSRNITDLKRAEAKAELAHQQLLETSRLAGMAEVATSVLHNVGNVLNSVNVSHHPGAGSGQEIAG